MNSPDFKVRRLIPWVPPPPPPPPPPHPIDNKPALVDNKPALVQVMACAVHATSHYLNQWWLYYRRIYVSCGLNDWITLHHTQYLCTWFALFETGQFYPYRSGSLHWHQAIDLIHKSQNSPVPYPTMLHSEQKCAHLCSEWSIVEYETGAFWDSWNWLIVTRNIAWIFCEPINSTKVNIFQCIVWYLVWYAL